jgi:hypothetical protein
MGRRFGFCRQSAKPYGCGVQASDFLTVNEKRAAVGYGALPGGDALTPQPPP